MSRKRCGCRFQSTLVYVLHMLNIIFVPDSLRFSHLKKTKTKNNSAETVPHAYIPADTSSKYLEYFYAFRMQTNSNTHSRNIQWQKFKLNVLSPVSINGLNKCLNITWLFINQSNKTKTKEKYWKLKQKVKLQVR